ncbi:hypothetical protein [Candidatus Thiodictyon syntrophicum]|jgi:hypothetical protein|uniref:hypothetical protein n=1 Tax=Candidatus Thiodictyon syntrophicum TaxID=1166950 RepID=UPI0012FE4564|nr:hypothetical protein [Candidatus Thiodictyon syntrophicum]
MLHTTLGTSRLLARPGDRRLWLLDAATAALWDLHAAGWAPAPLAALLVERFGLNTGEARDYLDNLRGHWRAAGLLADAPAGLAVPVQSLPTLSPPDGAPPLPGAWRLRVAQRTLTLAITDDALGACLAPLLAPLMVPLPIPDQPDRGRPSDGLILDGTVSHWSFTANGRVWETGHGRDGALVAMLHGLTEFGCRTSERLLVVHGGGLVAPDGRAFLLVAPGGSGKSTLTAALNAAGYGLLSDDVVPVTPDGELVGLGLPLCLKPGSWPVLAGCRPDLAQAPTVQRLGQSVRFLPPCGRAATGLRAPALFLFPRFRPGRAPRCEPLTPARALQGIIEAEAVIRDLTQIKLEALARWVSKVPAYAVSYPDLDQGLALVRDLLNDRDSREYDAHGTSA